MKWIKRAVLLSLLASAVVVGFRLGRLLRIRGGRGGRGLAGRLTDWVRTSVPAARVMGELKTIRSQNDRILSQNERIYVQNDRILSILERHTARAT
ncbi:MAG: hypothetical protein K1X95_05950 [Acidimicrobiia bacterium]|nr:hypothetical protein [Acidimicrobiia bacterium]